MTITRKEIYRQGDFFCDFRIGAIVKVVRDNEYYDNYPKTCQVFYQSTVYSTFKHTQWKMSAHFQ